MRKRHQIGGSLFAVQSRSLLESQAMKAEQATFEFVHRAVGVGFFPETAVELAHKDYYRVQQRCTFYHHT